MDFPCFVYRPGGQERAHGKAYSLRHVRNAAEMEAALADGWLASRNDALFPKLVTPPAIKPEPVSTVPPDDAPPTREEMEQRAVELRIRVDGRWSDKRLLTEIEKAGG